MATNVGPWKAFVLLLASCAAAGCASSGSKSGSIGGLLSSGPPYVYAVKFTCVAEVGPAVAVPVEAPFLPAVYRTVVNVHNPHGKAVTFRKKAVLARSEDLVRGQITTKVQEGLKPDEALAIDCLDVQGLFGGPQPIGDGFVVLESESPLDVTAVYTTLFIEEKQEILFRLVSEPYKTRAILPNGTREAERLPALGPPPAPAPPLFSAFHPEIIAVDFEKMYGVLNKIIYTVELGRGEPGCPGKSPCTGTRELLIPAPEMGSPFPPGGLLEDLVRAADPRFVRIFDVEATLFQEHTIKQEVTWRWVSDPVKVIVDFKGQYEPVNVVDLIEEKVALPGGSLYVEVLDTDIAVGVGEGEHVEVIQPSRKG